MGLLVSKQACGHVKLGGCPAEGSDGGCESFGFPFGVGGQFHRYDAVFGLQLVPSGFSSVDPRTITFAVLFFLSGEAFGFRVHLETI